MTLLPDTRPAGRRPHLPIVALALLLALVGCSADSADELPPAQGEDTGQEGIGGGAGDIDAPPTIDDGSSNGTFTLSLPEAPATLSEGGEALVVRVALERLVPHERSIELAVEGMGADGDELVLAFADTGIGAAQSETTLAVALPIGPLPRLPTETRTLRVVATDGATTPVEVTLTLEVEPTDRPDVYLLAGQSNMVGSSEPGARQALPGEPDAPDPRISQLNVTWNDGRFFDTPADFTDPAAIAVLDAPLLPALDPLHDPYDGGEEGKNGTMIGLGLSFAKAALPNTTADIVLVPSAWSDTGFCSRPSNRFPGSGWNAVEPESEAFAGTLLHDRAIARTNLALSESGGILRGILWHQGEADAATLECALSYDENLREMVASLRTNIAADARGAAARGAGADIPFIVGTLSRGDDDRSDPLAPFGGPKETVDQVLRDVANVVPFSDVVIADDLVPPAFPCGQGFCIHFGAAALREMGVRYHERLRGVLGGR